MLGKVQRGLAVLCQSFSPVAKALQGNARLLQHGPVARQHGNTVERAPDPPSGQGLKVLDGSQRNVSLLRLGQDGLGQWMLRGLLQRGRYAQQFLLRHPLRWDAVGDRRFSLSQGACLVHHHGTDRVEGFQRLGGFNEDAVFRALAGTHHNGHRSSQAQGAGAGDHQHRHSGGEGRLNGPGEDKPHHRRHQSNANHHGHKDPGHLVGQFGNGSLGGRGLLHQFDHLGQGGVLPYPGGSEHKVTGFIDGSGGYLVADPFLHRQGLAGEGGLVHRGVPFHHDPVHRDAAAGTHHHQVAHRYLFHRDLHLCPIPQNRGSFRGQIHQPGNGLTGLSFGPGLQPLAQGNEGKDHTG